uniref:G-patch domain-containing protein n=1 Tax=Romanomermis culicivorax TaxID=13658 RepID=A0A915K5R6_ROMCU
MASISFKFSKQIRSKLVPSSSETPSSSATVNFSSKDEGDDETASEDYRSKKSIIALDREKGFQDVKKQDNNDKDSAIVIPPLQNTLNLAGKSPNDEYSIAKMALLEDVRKFKVGEFENDKADLKRKIQVEEKIDFKRTTNLPESSAEADYDNIPVECFGKALLRGMGWREGLPIGRSSNKIVKPWITEPRPRGLGLGAESQKSKLTIDEKNQNSTTSIKKGDFVRIVKNGQYGVVVGVDNEGARLFVKLRDNEKEILNLGQFAAQIVQKSEYEKVKNEESVENAPEKKRNGNDNVPKSPKTASWLFADLKVRLIDRKNVTTPENCNCRLISNRKILDDLHFTKLETIVPKDRGSHVKILTGRYKGRTGKLIERDSKKSEATIRLLDEEAEKILNFSFDDICEFIKKLAFREQFPVKPLKRNNPVYSSPENT